MKQFFTIAFGGMFAIGVGIGISYGGSVAWDALKPHFSGAVAAVSNAIDFSHYRSGSHSADAVSTAEAATVIQSAAPVATTVSGFKRIVRFTADEEEDLINSAAGALPLGPDGKVTATAYLVKNLTRGDSPIEHNADTLLPIASLTKLATAAVARRLISADARVTITQDIMNTYGNTAGFKVGETFKASDLMYPLLMVSSNDAAEAFAQSYGRAKFIKAMNDFVQEIGAYRTYFDDPSGLSPLNVSTAHDLALIIDWIRNNDPEILRITEVKAKTIRAHTWMNPTHFLSWSSYAGGKNGFTDEANRTGTSLFELGKNKNMYVVVVLGSDNRDNDVLRLLGKVNE